MKILVLLENDSIQIPNEILQLQKSLSYPKDTLKISSDTDNTNVTDYDISIYVYYENPIDTFFKVKVTTEDKKINDTEYLSTSDNLPSTIKDIIYLIYNYRKIIITELFTSNTYTMYFFQKYTFNIESDIKVVSTDNHKINAVTDEYIKCFVDSKLEMMMKKNDLILKGKNNTYRLVKVDGEYYIEFDSEAIKDDAIHYLNETNLKNELQTYLSKLSFNTKPLQDAINNINFEESINARYNEWIKGLRHKNISADDILDICCKIRHYDDHRQNYYKKLVDVYDDKLAKEKRKQKYKQKDANTEVNENKTVKVIDNKPPGSLKDYVYRNDK